MVKTEGGRCLRRNRAHLRETSEGFAPDLESDETISLSDSHISPSTTCNERNVGDGTLTNSGSTAASMSGGNTLNRSCEDPISSVNRPKRDRNPPKRLIEE